MYIAPPTPPGDHMDNRSLKDFIRSANRARGPERTFLGIIDKVTAIGKKLFPYSYIIREDVMKEVERLAVEMLQEFEAFHLEVKLCVQRAESVNKKRPPLMSKNKAVLEGIIAEWKRMMK